MDVPLVQQHHLQLHRSLPKDLFLLPGYKHNYMTIDVLNRTIRITDRVILN